MERLDYKWTSRTRHSHVMQLMQLMVQATKFGTEHVTGLSYGKGGKHSTCIVRTLNASTYSVASVVAA
jgi:hypothetical protein